MFLDIIKTPSGYCNQLHYKTHSLNVSTYVSAGSAVVSAICQSEWGRTAHTHCDTSVGNPHRSFLTKFEITILLLYSLKRYPRIHGFKLQREKLDLK